MNEAVNLVLHAGEGRLSLHVALIKEQHDAARALGRSLAALRGVHQVKITPSTGHVVIRYDPCRISTAQVLRRLGLPSQESRGAGHTLMKLLAIGVLYVAARRFFRPWRGLDAISDVS
jgi:hypothetical protein